MDVNASSIASPQHLIVSLRYWLSCAVTAICWEVKALCQALVNGQSVDWLAKLG